MNLKGQWRQFRRGLLPKVAPLAYAVASFIGRTQRLKSIGWEEYRDFDGPIIYAGWHGRTMIPAHFFRNKGFWALVSTSRDGEMQNGIFQRFGFRTIRGSTGRQGVQALREAIRELKAGGCMAFTPDGPRGPSGVVQEGILIMAQKSGALIVPVGSSSRWRKLIRSWDRFMVPCPFSRAVIVFGDAISVSSDADKNELELVRQRVANGINRVEAIAEAEMGHGAHP